MMREILNEVASLSTRTTAGDYVAKIHNIDQALAQMKSELLKEVEKESEDIDRTCREFLPYSVSTYIPDLVKALKNQIQQIIEEMCK